jgi:hypothetical protein
VTTGHLQGKINENKKAPAALWADGAHDVVCDLNITPPDRFKTTGFLYNICRGDSQGWWGGVRSGGCDPVIRLQSNKATAFQRPANNFKFKDLTLIS